MKIALQISGQIRRIEDSFKSIKERIINPTNCDIFIKACKDEHIDSLYKFLSEDDCKGWEVVEDFFIEKSGVRPVECINKDTIQNIYQQMYAIYKVNKLRTDYEKENGFIYDWVIRCRFDLTFNKNLPDFNELKENTLYVPPNDSYTGINDKFAIGTPEVMNFYSNRFNIIDTLTEPDFNMERQLKRLIKEAGIKIEFLELETGLVGRDIAIQVKQDKKIAREYGEWN